MNIEMVFDEAVLKFILKNNLIDKCRSLISPSEVLPSLTEDPDERAYLQSQVATRMVIAGLSTTTSVAVLTGGLLVGLMH